jgi:hypothetical protein
MANQAFEPASTSLRTRCPVTTFAGEIVSFSFQESNLDPEAGVLGVAALTSACLDKWTDGTYNDVWTSYVGQILAGNGYTDTNAVTPWPGPMQITPASGSGPTLDLADFNLQQAEAPGAAATEPAVESVSMTTMRALERPHVQ